MWWFWWLAGSGGTPFVEIPIIHPLRATVAYSHGAAAAVTGPQQALVAIPGYSVRVTWPEL